MATMSTKARLHLLSARGVLSAANGNHADGGGLQMRVGAQGASWVLRYTSPTGRRREMGLGIVARSNLKQAGGSLTGARDAAHKAREQLRQGLDPIEQRDAAKALKREAELARKAEEGRERWTLARCARDYHERVIERTRTPKHSAQWISSLENHMPTALWRMPIDAVTPPLLLQGLLAAEPHERARRHGNLGETLRRVRQRLDCVFEDAQFYGRCESNPAAAIRRKLTESQPTREKGQLAELDYRQAPSLLARIRSMSGTAPRCLEFAVLTTSRTSEVLLAAWDEIDLDRGVWVVPASRMKRQEEHTVHLSTRAVEIVKAQTGQDAVLVFPTPQTGREGRPLSNMTMLTVLDRLGVRDQTTVHGLCRATFSTWANETSAARPDVIEACLAHSEADRVRKAYNRAQFTEERRALLEAWSAYLGRPAIALAA
jgi:integrase